MNLGAIFQTWLNVLTRPGEQVFESERSKPQATLGTALVMIVIAAVIGGLFAIIRGWFFQAQFAAIGGMDAIFGQADLPPEVRQQMEALFSSLFSPGVGIAGAITSILFSILGFLIFVGVLFLIGRVLGGQGEFGRYSYLNAAIFAPLTIVGGVIGFIPFVGICLGLPLLIYEIVLCYFATKVEQQLSSGRAIVVVLSPLILVAILVICFGAALASMAVSLMNQ